MALALHRAKFLCRLCPVCTEYVAEKTTTTAKVCNCVIRMASPDAIPLQLRHLGLSLSPDPHEPPLPQGQRCFLIKDKAAHTSSHRTAPPFALFCSACCRFCASKSSLRCRLLGAATRYPSTQSRLRPRPWSHQHAILPWDFANRLPLAAVLWLRPLPCSSAAQVLVDRELAAPPASCSSCSSPRMASNTTSTVEIVAPHRNRSHSSPHPAKRRRTSSWRTQLPPDDAQMATHADPHSALMHGHDHDRSSDRTRHLLGESADDTEDAQASKSKRIEKMITPYLAQHIPHQYNPLGARDGHDTKYCYRHRPDLLCRRQADEPSMEQLQMVLAPISILNITIANTL
jgi:hypothetical protein